MLTGDPKAHTLCIIPAQTQAPHHLSHLTCPVLPQGLIQGAGGRAFKPTGQNQAQPMLTCSFSCERGSTLR